MTTRLLGAALGTTLLASFAGAQVYDTVCFESFDYPAGSLQGQGGGTGWANTWWSNGGTPQSADVLVPGLDAIGGCARDVLENVGSYRVPDSGAWPAITENLQFGADGAEIWIDFLAVRAPLGDDEYGGVSLNLQFVGEKLFLGSPFQTYEWGYQVPGGASGTVAGSSVDVPTHLVYRIQFQPGDEQLSLWVNPASDHPTTTPDLTAPVPDMRWNEFRLQSGVFTSVHGYDFDALRVTTPRLEPGFAFCFGDGAGTACPCGNNNDGSNGAAGCANGVNPGGGAMTAAGDASVSADTVVFTATGVQPNQPGLFFRADNAVNSGLGNAFGDGLRCAGGNVIRLGTVFADGSGTAVSTSSAGAGLSAGDVKRYQYWYRNPAGTPCGAAFNLTNGYEITWGM
ncbi:MAG: hypothetical protein H6828_14335 [Planctomycetes bacterium]|nr:hypothetical protein [Planctomycetota bacterium]